MINNQLQKSESRRSVVKKLFGGTAALLVAGTIVAGGLTNGVSAGTGIFKTTAALNLRSQASTTSAVILVIPQGEQVTQVGPDLNGFKKVSYSGKTGYAHASFLYVQAGSGGGDIPAYRGVAVTTGAANMRSAPGTEYSILRVIPANTTIEVYDEYENYYWLIRYNGQFGYVHSSLMSSNGAPTEFSMTTTAALNMRTQASSSGQLITVVPAGAKVTATLEFSNGYRGVTYGQYSGWVLSSYLK
jgi:uncharacterized protein YgiM (DUF1202 family)